MVRAVWILLALGFAALANRLASSVTCQTPATDLLVRCRNQAAFIEGSLRQLYRSGRYRVIYVQDDGSSDETSAILECLSRELGLVWLEPGVDPPEGVTIIEGIGMRQDLTERDRLR